MTKDKRSIYNDIDNRHNCNGNSLVYRNGPVQTAGIFNELVGDETNSHTFKMTKNYDNYISDIPIDHLVLWRHPLITMKYFIYQIKIEMHELIKRIQKNRIKVAIIVSLLTVIIFACYIPGIHQRYLQNSRKQIIWCVYWIGLGVLSSIGLGTGLHTFVLYLGPHIASVTIAAYECNSLKFPQPPYPDEIICPSVLKSALLNGNGFTSRISLLAIMKKVYLEAFMWGAGTALGELPPYFMARAARTSGSQPFDENYEAFEELLEQQQTSQLQFNQLSYLNQAKLYMQNLVQNIGFYGILLCASIPNPLFDFAGITCGHFNVPFWTFFGATLIGKAIIKVHLQELFVIIMFSEHHVDRIVALLKYVPFIGTYLQAPFKEYLTAQKAKLHQSKKRAKQKVTWLAWCFEKILLFMIAYFLTSIINSMAQKYAFTLEKKRRHVKRRRSHEEKEGHNSLL